jgi:hypothetical protein
MHALVVYVWHYLLVPVHFHRNFASGDKNGMRCLWAAALNGPEDLSGDLIHLKYLAPDSVTCRGDESVILTLRGLLRRDWPSCADALYAVITSEERFFRWYGVLFVLEACIQWRAAHS